MKANAVVFSEAGQLQFRAVDLRLPAANEVVVETGFSSISSGTERLLFQGKLPALPHFGYPLVPGYEAAGTVVETGADVRDIHVGDEVFVGGSMCYTDIVAAFGGQSSRLIKRAEQVVSLNGIALAHAPLLALAATALHGVRRLGDCGGRRVAVLGMGGGVSYRCGRGRRRGRPLCRSACNVERGNEDQRIGRSARRATR